jgi:hypothetical protein
MLKGAKIDDTGEYRYSLAREWNAKLGKVLFILLNPSTADATFDDPTVKKCIGFAERWGFESLKIVNLFAYRATDPEELVEAKDPVGSDNDRWIREAVKRTDFVVVGWGNLGPYICKRCINCSHRIDRVLNIIKDSNPHCLAITKERQPKHPLFASYALKPIPYIK